jgi:TonB-linked SusC/RagA family outer membrane protein
VAKIRNFFLPAVLVFFSCAVFAQEGKIQIEGRIIDSNTKDPLIGASVAVENTKTGTAAGEDGWFYLAVESFPVTIIVEYLGYDKQKIEVFDTSEQPVTVALVENASYLDEVVIVGYGTQKRKELTGAISTVARQYLDYNVAPSVDGLLSGAVAGVSVTQASGQPGAPASIRIRGGNSVNAGNDPLYVIDGFIFYSDKASSNTGVGGIESEINPLNLLNPSDVETIEALKDVSATAIYGSRGSNGVIIISTKKGKRNGNSIHYQYSAGFARSAKRLDLLDGPQWIRLQKDYFTNKGGYTEEQIPTAPTYDWQNAALQTGISHTHEFSIGGGDKSSRYFISGNYLKQEGIIINSGFNRFIGRINYEKELFKNLTAGVNLTANRGIQNTLTTFEDTNYNDSPYSHGIANSLTYALYIPPVVPIYSGGDYNYGNRYEYTYLRQGDRTANPVSDLRNSSAQNIQTVFLGGAFLKFVPLEGLTLKINVGSNISNIRQNYFAPSYTAIGLELHGVGGAGNRQQEILLSEYTATYSREIGDKHSFDLLAGYTAEKTVAGFSTVSSSGFTNETLGFNNLQDGEKYLPPITGASKGELYSLLGRINYSFLNRYHLTANIRSDYSTRLAKKHRRKTFPSVGISWNIDEEPFLSGSKSALSLLKLRASGGTVGNQEGIGDYEFLRTLTAIRYGGTTGYKVNNSGNSGLTWETTAQYNIGLDAGLFDNRFTATIDAYYKKTSDLLLRIPPKLGESSDQLVNVGSVTNRGIEFGLNATLINSRRLRWSLSFNIARNINRITALYGNETKMIQGLTVLKTGSPLGSFYGLKFDGIVQNDENTAALPTTPAYKTPTPGEPKYKELSNDNHINENDRTTLGSNQPDFTYGLANTIGYKNFDLYFMVQGAHGNKIYNQLRSFLETPTDACNASAALLDAWTPVNPSNTVPRIQKTKFHSLLDSRYIEDASYLRLKVLTAGYRIHLRRLDVRVFASVQNLLTITAYKGYDPEIDSGVDMGTYPTARTLTFGISINI